MAAGEPQLYRRYRREEILSLFGHQGVLPFVDRAGESRELCDGQWVIYPDVAVGIAVVPDVPHTHFRSSSCFCWVAEKPYEISAEDPLYSFLPDEVRANDRRPRVYQGPQRHIWLFVRRSDWIDYLCIGQAKPCASWAGRDGIGQADFDLKASLPSRIWAEIHGTILDPPDHDRVDAALSKLPSADANMRFAILQELVTYWHGSIGAEDGVPDEILDLFPMPQMLRRWYRFAGRRSNILSGINFLSDPEALRLADDRLVFYRETEGAYFCATRPQGDDPPVFTRGDDTDPWVLENMALSEHLILACLYEGLFRAPYGGWIMGLDQKIIDEITAVIPPIAIPPWRWDMGKQFHARGGAFMTVDEFGSLMIGAKTQEAVLFLRAYADRDWDHKAF
jgi:hypothetical protein